MFNTYVYSAFKRKIEIILNSFERLKEKYPVQRQYSETSFDRTYTKKSSDGIMIDQKHYINKLGEIPEDFGSKEYPSIAAKPPGSVIWGRYYVSICGNETCC